MSALLRYLNITDVKSYREWALKNHPDKKPGDSEATHRFQEVSAEFAKHHGNQTQSPPPPKKRARYTTPAPDSMNNMFAYMFVADPHKWCHVRVKGTPNNLCFRKPHRKGATTCFYHMPMTDHLKYVEGDPVEFFGRLFMIKGERTAEMCTAKTKKGTYCRKAKAAGSGVCKLHAAAV